MYVHTNLHGLLGELSGPVRRVWPRIPDCMSGIAALEPSRPKARRGSEPRGEGRTATLAGLCASSLDFTYLRRAKSLRY